LNKWARTVSEAEYAAGLQIKIKPKRNQNVPSNQTTSRDGPARQM